MQDPTKLRVLASWYREFAERTASPTIWEARLHTAQDLDTEANRIEQGPSAPTAQAARHLWSEA